MTSIDSLKSLIDASTSPYHCIQEASRRLSQAGFERLELSKPWAITPGGAYFVPAYDSTLLAFTVDKDAKKPSDVKSPASHTAPVIRMAAAHTDWPCLKLKPSPEVSGHGYGKLNVEVYGSPILSTWLDRPLAAAGKVCVASEDPFHPETRLLCCTKPLFTIPNLAIHMNRDVNKGVELNPQVDMLPLAAVLTEHLNRDRYFLDFLAGELSVESEAILDYEIYLYTREEGCLLGLKEELYSSPRLDNLTSVEACLAGLIAGHKSSGSSGNGLPLTEEGSCKGGKQDGSTSPIIRVIALYDNEEVGSRTKQGAASNLTERILEKLYLSLGYDRSQFLDGLLGGFLLSLDVAQAIHPNHPEKCDIKNQIPLGSGVVLKLSASQAYATDASCVSVIEGLCRANQIPFRKFSNRSDMRGGSTLGSISSAFLNMPAVDAGIPLLAMHSSRELMHREDQKALNMLTAAFFQG